MCISNTYVSGLVCKNEKTSQFFYLCLMIRLIGGWTSTVCISKMHVLVSLLKVRLIFFLQKTSNGLDHCELKKENSKIFCHTFNR